MNILLQSDEYAPHWGPCTVRLKVFSDVFRQKGNHVSVLASSTNIEGNAMGEENALYCSTIKMKKKSALYRLGNNLSFAYSSFFRSFQLGKIELVLSTSPPLLIGISGWMIARIKGAKLIYDVRDIWPDVAIEMEKFTKDSFYYKVFSFIAKFMYRHADVITTVSPGKMKKLQSKLPKEKRGKIWLIENGLDEMFLDQEEDIGLIKKYDLEKKFTCVYIGNIGLAQGLTHLLDLAETVDPQKYQFLLFGNGAEKDKLEQSAMKRGLMHVKFCGVIDSKSVYTVLKNAYMTYIPLVNANLRDSIPTKTYEALGVGCPILMVAEGDAPKLLEECKLGLSLSPDDIEQLPVFFHKFCDNYEAICSQRDYAKKIVLERHSRQRIAEQFENRLCMLIEKGEFPLERQRKSI